jgi:pyrroline-5-carboxylate reductase
MLQGKKVGFIGAGNMAEALIHGLIDTGVTNPGNIFCSDVNEERLSYLNKSRGIHISGDNLEVVRASDLIVYAVKPQVMDAVLKQTVPFIDLSKVIVSIAAGISLSVISGFSTEPLRLIRAMPNVCVSVQAGATAIVAGSHARNEDLRMAQAVFESVGRCILLTSEDLLDAVTGLSGSGPAYVFLIMEAMADAGVKAGLPRNQSLLLSAQTLFGAAKMYLDRNVHPAQLKDMVTSPGGTTIAGLYAMETGAVRGIMMAAVQAAIDRSKALGKPKS